MVPPANTQHEDILAQPLADLELSVSSYTALRKKGIETIQDLITFTSADGWAIKTRPLSLSSAREISKTLGEAGLADTGALVRRCGYPERYCRRKPLSLSRMALAMPMHESAGGMIS